jgi:hypothetical protein
MSHSLRFLCYHHLYNIVNRQQSLRDLYLTIKERYFITEDRLSNSLTILGVCNEIVGAKEAADQFSQGVDKSELYNYRISNKQYPHQRIVFESAFCPDRNRTFITLLKYA